jgi:hypothetical protein
MLRDAIATAEARLAAATDVETGDGGPALFTSLASLRRRLAQLHGPPPDVLSAAAAGVSPLPGARGVLRAAVLLPAPARAALPWDDASRD